MNKIYYGRVAIGAFFINQLLWIIFIYTFGFFFIQISGIDLVNWASLRPGYVIFWNCFNDMVPYFITSVRQNFNFNITKFDNFMVSLFFGYTLLGLLVAWRWSNNPFLLGLDYGFLTLLIFINRFGLISFLTYKAQMKHVIDIEINN